MPEIEELAPGQGDVPAQHPAAATAERVYENEQIRVYWEPRLCIHTANCIRNLPEVFRSQERPWVKVDAAGADAIAAAVMTCPTGALHFERRDGGMQEPVPEQATIEVRPNGPLWMRGNLQIQLEGGAVRQVSRAVLCRCGASGNKPFCDATHRKIGFRSRPV